MRYGTYTLPIPNNPEYSVPQLKMLLKEVERILGKKISLDEWEELWGVIKLEIIELQKEEEKSRDEYVHKSNSSTFYHQIGWKNVVEKTYKHKPIYLIAKEEGEIKGVLPLFLMKSMFFSKKLVSVPFAHMVVFVQMTKQLKKHLLKKQKGFGKITMKRITIYI